ncbi:hypothetical protein GH810_06335 [Acetobacterium paludosum]|uniref:Uncharacterized protein n=1 Tax=Acetobacterium paludosum TaxID=52693 RepID=A0A923I2J9_9FIRM|nr:hypothetical protein [Acetobacterium paludosum]MBC3887925.1 hypothetical protein [Acetobacterium paludosum]
MKLVGHFGCDKYFEHNADLQFHKEIIKKETLKIIQKMVEIRQITGACELAKLVNAKDIKIIQNRIWRSQNRKYLPLIEIER